MKLLAGGAVAVLLVLPAVLSSYAVTVFIFIFFYAYLAQAWNIVGQIEGTMLGSLARAEEAWRQALHYAERGNLRAERAESIGWLLMSANFGPLPVAEGIALCKSFQDEAFDDPLIQAHACVDQAALEAMRTVLVRPGCAARWPSAESSAAAAPRRRSHGVGRPLHRARIGCPVGWR